MKSRKKIIFNGVFLAVVFALTIYGVFHGEDLSSMMDAIHRADKRWLIPGIALVAFFYLGRIHHHLVHDEIQWNPAEKENLFSVLFRGIFFQLYHTVRQWRTAHADLLHEKRKDFHSGVNGNSDDRNHHL